MRKIFFTISILTILLTMSNCDTGLGLESDPDWQDVESPLLAVYEKVN